MTLKWDVEKSENNRNYNLHVHSQNQDDIDKAMEVWWEKMCELALEAENWNTMVNDIWVETGRIIGHVQHSEEAIGTDRGFRVSVMFHFAGESMEMGEFSDTIYYEVSERLFQILDNSFQVEKVHNQLIELKSKKEFQMWWCENGQVIADPSL